MAKEKVLVHKFTVIVESDPRDTDTAEIEKDLAAVEGVATVDYVSSKMKLVKGATTPVEA